MGVIAGCRRERPNPAAERAAASAMDPPNPVEQPGHSAGRFVGPIAPERRVRVVEAPRAGEVAAIMNARMAAEAKSDRPVLLYVGASWCEPCERFHRAADAGELDDALGDVTFVAFDLDRDRDRLRRAGYAPSFVPHFHLPNADGTASSEMTEGSVKGSRGVDVVVPRIRALLAN